MNEDPFIPSSITRVGGLCFRWEGNVSEAEEIFEIIWLESLLRMEAILPVFWLKSGELKRLESEEIILIESLTGLLSWGTSPSRDWIISGSGFFLSRGALSKKALRDGAESWSQGDDGWR